MNGMKGRISIGCWNSNTPPYSGVRIEVIDEASRVHFLRVEMTPEQFAMAVFGRAEQKCEFELVGADTIGKKLEAKEEIVSFDGDDFNARDVEAAKRALKQHEVDGWIGRERDLFNHHNVQYRDPATGRYKMKVAFHRYVTEAA